MAAAQNTCPRAAAIRGCVHPRKQCSNDWVHQTGPSQATTISFPRTQSSPTTDFLAFLGNISLSTQILKSTKYYCDPLGPQVPKPSSSLSTSGKDSAPCDSVGDNHIRPLGTGNNQELQALAQPQRSHFPTKVESGKRAQVISEEVRKIIEKWAITKVEGHTGDQFVSKLFLVPKKDGQMRPIINLKPLNRFLAYQHFKIKGM